MTVQVPARLSLIQKPNTRYAATKRHLSTLKNRTPVAIISSWLYVLYRQPRLCRNWGYRFCFFVRIDSFMMYSSSFCKSVEIIQSGIHTQQKYRVQCWFSKHAQLYTKRLVHGHRVHFRQGSPPSRTSWMYWFGNFRRLLVHGRWFMLSKLVLCALCSPSPRA